MSGSLSLYFLILYSVVLMLFNNFFLISKLFQGALSPSKMQHRTAIKQNLNLTCLGSNPPPPLPTCIRHCAKLGHALVPLSVNGGDDSTCITELLRRVMELVHFMSLICFVWLELWLIHSKLYINISCYGAQVHFPFCFCIMCS